MIQNYIVATNERRGRDLMRALGLDSRDTVYVGNDTFLRGITGDKTIYIEDTYVESPKWVPKEPDGSNGHYVWPMTEAISFARNVLGVNVVYARSR